MTIPSLPTPRPDLLPRGRILSTFVEIGTSLDQRPELDPSSLIVRSLRLFAGNTGYPREEDGGTTFVVVQVYADLVPAEPGAVDAVIELGELAHYPDAAQAALATMHALSKSLIGVNDSRFSLESAWARTLGGMVNALANCSPSVERLKRSREAQLARILERFVTDPMLTPESIAEALGVSRRTLYSLDTPMGGPISEQIRHLRATHAARLLRQAEWDGVTLASIAQRTGFSSAKHMSRALAASGLGTPEQLRRDRD